MKVHRLRDPVYTSNVYLVTTQRPILIDTGASITEDIVAIVQQVLGAVHLHAIVLTHGHPDHIGGAAELANRLVAPLFIHGQESQALPQAKLLDDVLRCGDRDMRVLHTPGHSPGGVCLYEPQSKTLFSGDCVFPGGRVGRWDLPGADYDALCDSVRMLGTLQVNALYPGHYDPLSCGVAAHLSASYDTLKIVGRVFNDGAYDRRIQALEGTLA